MTRKRRRAGVAVVAVLFSVGSAASAAAQWPMAAIGVVEYDTKETFLLLGGVSASPGGSGMRPLIGVQAYFLSFDAGTSNTSVTTVKPYVGLRNNYSAGSAHLAVGYAFSSKDLGGPVSASVSDQGEGTVVSGGLDHWGTGGPWGFQVLGAYNFGTEALWTRGRATTRLGQSVGGKQKRFGGEVAFLNGSGYQAVQPGAILEFHSGNGHILGLGAGMKFFDGGGNAVYFKAEGRLPLVR
jgi:hypothetical protein